MHYTALEHGKRFFETYVSDQAEIRIAEIGSQDVNGSLRSVAPKNCQYTGVDFVAGKGVDVILTDPYDIPLESSAYDVCVTSSCFEHSEFFWLTYLEIMRVLKPSGLLYINVPSNGPFHRWPVDCWRFYPDSGTALQNWGTRNGLQNVLLESFTGAQKRGDWNDFVGVLIKDQAYADRYPRRILDTLQHYTNGKMLGRDGFSNMALLPEEQQMLSRLPHRVLRKLLRMI